MGRKCGVEGCLSDSNRPEDTGVTFHKVPMHSDIRPKWISLCRIPEDKKIMKVIYICSRHFLRVDFCNFKGKKYMLRQGVLPSVFPWDKSKLEAIKSVSKSETENTTAPNEYIDSNIAVETNVSMEESGDLKVEEENVTAEEHTEVQKTKEKTVKSYDGTINFVINSRIEVLDNNNLWYPARIVEVDYEENEVLIHFEKFSNKFDEWICMDSSRLRPLQLGLPNAPKKIETFEVGERVLAIWSDARKFPATVTKVLENDSYEVLFDDGYIKNLKAHRMYKSEGRPIQSSPLFDPIQSSKEERREKKRKINIAELFGKKPRLEADEKMRSSSFPVQQNTDSGGEEVYEPWFPQWENGKPVGIESFIETNDGPRKTVIVPDPRLPDGWTKHLTQRIHGASAGKWETIILSPDSRRFRSRNEIMAYLKERNLMKFNWSMFDFTIQRQRIKKKDTEPEVTQPETIVSDTISEPVTDEEENKNYLKIPIVDDAFQCPIDGCGKTYRKENLAQMHVKHYHPEYTKFLDSTPNVADLAYARTVGDLTEKSPLSKPPGIKLVQKATLPKATAKPLQTSQKELEDKTTSVPANSKDSEIIKLLNTKPFDGKKEAEQIKMLPTGLPLSMYPDIKLKDLLKSDGIPKNDDLNLKAFTTRQPSGIKTLLPVKRQENRPDQKLPDLESITSKLRSSLKRKRGTIDSDDSPKGNEPTDIISAETPPHSEPNNIIIEGGQVIKIVRMKQEEIINCTCGYTEEDGLMIQCDLCLCWQHAFCNNIERESQVPEKYVCWICQNPARQRLSKMYYHDQDWLKHGFLATANFHSRDGELLNKRFDKLKKSHDISGGLLELEDFVNTLRVKLKIAEAKNHPKLYLWAKPWNKMQSLEKVEPCDENLKLKKEEKCDQPPNNYSGVPKTEQAESMLMMILKNEKEENTDQEEKNLINDRPPIIPQPEVAIESADCRLNLLDHIGHSQLLIEQRLDELEKQIETLEPYSSFKDDNVYPKTRQTINMLLRDLNTLQELGHLTTL